MRIGIDFGGVLSQRDGKGVNQRAAIDPKTAEVMGPNEVLGANGHVNTAVDMPGALEVLRAWRSAGHRLYLISFCGRQRAIETAASIGAACPDLFEGMIFTRNKMHKGLICAHLGCQVMIDDSADVLQSVRKDSPQTLRYLYETRDGEWGALAALLDASIKHNILSSADGPEPRPMPPAAFSKLVYSMK